MSSFWYQEVQRSICTVLSHHSEKETFYCSEPCNGTIVSLSLEDKDVIYKGRGRMYNVICWNCCKVI